MLGKTCLMGELIYDNETAVYYTPHLTLSFHHKMQTRSLRTTNLSPGWPARSAGRPTMGQDCPKCKKTSSNSECYRFWIFWFWCTYRISSYKARKYYLFFARHSTAGNIRILERIIRGRGLFPPLKIKTIFLLKCMFLMTAGTIKCTFLLMIVVFPIIWSLETLHFLILRIICLQEPNLSYL